MLESLCPRCIVTIALLLLSMGSLGHAKDKKDSKYLDSKIQQAAQGLLNWGEKVSSKGIKAELREVNRGQQQGKLMVAYEIYISGASRNRTYSLWQWPLNRSEIQVVSPEVYLADDGRVCMNNDPHCPMPVNIAFVPAKGEPFRLAVVSKDGKSMVAFLAVPDPITGADQSCKVEAMRLTPRFEGAILRGEGFKPNEEVRYTSNSAGEILQDKIKADSAGRFRLIMAPYVVGKDTGTDELEFRGTACSPKVSFEWGAAKD